VNDGDAHAGATTGAIVRDAGAQAILHLVRHATTLAEAEWQLVKAGKNGDGTRAFSRALVDLANAIHQLRAKIAVIQTQSAAGHGGKTELLHGMDLSHAAFTDLERALMSSDELAITKATVEARQRGVEAQRAIKAALSALEDA